MHGRLPSRALESFLSLLVLTASAGALPRQATLAPSGRTASGPSCTPTWLSTFGSLPGLDRPPACLLSADLGNGSELFAGGFFVVAPNSAARGVVRRTEHGWSPLGSGPGTSVRALCVFDDGGGPALYAGGTFTTLFGAFDHVARWDGSGWSAVGSGLDGTVSALTVFDPGSGPLLVAGGHFAAAGAIPAARIAAWDGAQWTALASSVDGQVLALATYDDGSGPALYAGGNFTAIDGVLVQHVARWDGVQWSALNGGVTGDIGDVRALTVFDDGRGPALYAGGRFLHAGAASFVGRIARWDGLAWDRVGPPGTSGVNALVDALVVHDDGNGPALYAGGDFTAAAGVPARHVARWDGTSWTSLDAGLDDRPLPSTPYVTALASLDEGDGPRLWAGGSFRDASGTPALNVATWDGLAWAPTGTGLDDEVDAVLLHDDGSGPALFVAGQFEGAAGVALNHVGRWDGTSWSPLGQGTDEPVRALVAFDDGSGPGLFAGGWFTLAGGVPAAGIARWDGLGWTVVESLALAPYRIEDLVVFDPGTGPALHACGQFRQGSTFVAGVARHDGTDWVLLEGGFDGAVETLVVHDDGSGAALFAGGRFTLAAGHAAGRVARWDGTRWSALGTGVDDWVFDLAVADLGGGARLFAGGRFQLAGGVPAAHVARWDGAGWSALGPGTSSWVDALLGFDDGTGPALIAGGHFLAIDGAPVNRIASWDGASWAPLGAGFSATAVSVLAEVNGALIVGGSFTTSLQSGDAFLARWGCDTTAPVLECPDAIVVAERFGSLPGEIVHFEVPAHDDSGEPPLVDCFPPSGSVFPPGTTLVSCTALDAAGNVSGCSFPVTVTLKARTARNP